MKNLDKRLDYLLEEARNQSPQLSFTEVSSRFNDTLGAGNGLFSQAWIGKLFSVVGVITITSLLIVQFTDDSSYKQMKSIHVNHPVPRNMETTFAFQKINEKSSVREEEGISSPDMKEDELAFSIDLITPEEVRTKELPLIEHVVNRSSVSHSKPIVTGTEPGKQSRLRQLPNSREAPSKLQRLVTITEMTTMKELEKIEAMAREAGVDFHFHVRHHFHVHKDNDPRNPSIPLIRDLRGYVAIDGSEIIEAYKVRVPKRGKFKLSFGWYVDSEGRAFKLASFLVEKEDQTKHPKD